MNKKTNKEEIIVPALRNGTVIDHIPSDKLFKVMTLLHLDRLKSQMIFGYNVGSLRMKDRTKSIIKVSDRYFSSQELNQLSVICPNVTLNVIHEYEVVEKRQVVMPDELHGIMKCANPKCITNHEPMETRFKVIDKEKGVIRCHYCEKEQVISPDNIIK
jgi:aspartate carbamoyltransferase regulatory subunit